MPHAPPPPDEGAAAVDAVVIWMTPDRRVRVRLENGGEEQLSVPKEMFELLRLGLRVVLYHGPDGELLGWFLPEHELGQDLRS